MLKSLFHIWIASLLLMNSMVYSLIKVSFTMNQQYIIENFCINTDKPEMHCDGKCFLAEKMKAAKDQRESTPALTFSQNFGVYISNSTPQIIHPIQEDILMDHQSFYTFHLGQVNAFEIEHPPRS